MGELILNHFKVVYILNNKTNVACVDKTDLYCHLEYLFVVIEVRTKRSVNEVKN